MRINSYRDLEVWKKAIDLVIECYVVANVFPVTERYGLTSQLKRAAVSVPANIAEGHSKWYKKEYIYHLSIAYGSLAELETHIYIGEKLGYIEIETVNKIIEKTNEIGRMINGLKKSLKT